MEGISVNSKAISPIDALWALIQTQSKTVRKALMERLMQDEQILDAQHKDVKDSLNRAFEELYEGKAKHNARELFA